MTQLDIQRLIITEPTSAYEIINRIIQLVLDEPKRMRMGTWFAEGAETAGLTNRPACGTVGCISGWTQFVTGCHQRFTKVADVLFEPGTAGHLKFMIGFTSGRHFILRDGTQEQADAVAEFLRRIQSTYERELKERIIQPPSKRERLTNE